MSTDAVTIARERNTGRGPQPTAPIGVEVISTHIPSTTSMNISPDISLHTPTTPDEIALERVRRCIKGLPSTTTPEAASEALGTSLSLQK